LHTEYKARKGDINRDKGDKRDKEIKKEKLFPKVLIYHPGNHPGRVMLAHSVDRYDCDHSRKQQEIRNGKFSSGLAQPDQSGDFVPVHGSERMDPGAVRSKIQG
jgi:hypothetical protein